VARRRSAPGAGVWSLCSAVRSMLLALGVDVVEKQAWPALSGGAASRVRGADAGKSPSASRRPERRARPPPRLSVVRRPCASRRLLAPHRISAFAAPLLHLPGLSPPPRPRPGAPPPPQP
jgi:hypothetical protein